MAGARTTTTTYSSVPVALVCLLLASVNPSRARACRVDVFGSADAAWREAAEQLALGAADCSALHIELEGDVALVTLVRSDGKRVARTLTHPRELREAIEALKRADPDEVVPIAPTRTEPVAPLSPTAGAAVASEPPTRRAISPMFGLLFGVRIGQSALLSPVVDTSFLLRVRSWEVGLLTDWELKYHDKPTSTTYRGIAPALSFARRQPLAGAEFLAGGRLGLAIMRRDAQPNFISGAGRGGAIFIAPSSEYQGRLAAFLGYVRPLHPFVHLRIELSGDGVWMSSYSAGVRLGPYWAVGMQVGLEFGAL